MSVTRARPAAVRAPEPGPRGAAPDLRADLRCSRAAARRARGVRRLPDLSELRHLLHARLGQGARPTGSCPTTTCSARRRRTRSRRSSAGRWRRSARRATASSCSPSLFGLLGFYVVTFVFTERLLGRADRAARGRRDAHAHGHAAARAAGDVRPAVLPDGLRRGAARAAPAALRLAGARRCSRSPGCCGRRRGCSRGVYWLWLAPRHAAPAADPLRAARGRRAAALDGLPT